MKTVIIIVGIIAVIGIIVGIVFLVRPAQPAATGQATGTSQTTTPVGGLPAPTIMNFPDAPQTASFTIGTPTGQVVVNNFYKLPVVQDENYLILENTNDYQITYDMMSGQFFIYNSSTPLDAARQKGEAAFLAMLGVSQPDACKLNVLEGYPASSSYGNQEPGLSFCSAAGAFQAQ